MSEPEQEKSSSAPVKMGNQELFHAPPGPNTDPKAVPFGEESPIRPSRNSSAFLALLVGLFVIGAGALLVLTQNGTKAAKPKFAPYSDDLGAGISQASGLRGHLVTRWQGKAQYMLKIDPLDPRDADGFAAVTANPSKPISINIRLLDSAGFALCGKEIVLRFDPARAGHANLSHPKGQSDAERLLADAQRVVQQESASESESGKDVFQNIQGSDGAVDALWAQGDLPCSPDQYKRFDYWDLSTNFPTLAEQDQALGHKRTETASNDESQSNRDARAAAKRRAAKKSQSAYLMQGDDRATEFDSTRGLLVVGTNMRFLIDQKSDEKVVAGWADDDSLIHFTCDSHANCSLRHAGSASVVSARMNE